MRVVGLIEPADARSARALRGLVVADVSTAQEILGPTGATVARRPHRAAGAGGGRGPGPDSGGPASRGGGRGRGGAERVRRRADARLRREPDGAVAPGADGRAVSRLQHDDVLGGPAPRDDRDAAGSRRHAGRDRRRSSLPRRCSSGWSRRPSGSRAGVALGGGLVRLVTRTINDLYFVVVVRDLAVSRRRSRRARPWDRRDAARRRIVPAAEASMTPPGAAIRRVALEARARRAAPRAALAGAARGRGGRARCSRGRAGASPGATRDCSPPSWAPRS